MDKKSEKVTALTIEAADFLLKGGTAQAEARYKLALAEGVRLLGLRHSLTRNVMSLYSVYLRASQRDDEALRYEALYWKTAPPECYRLAVLFDSVKLDVVEYLEKNSDWVESWGQQMSLDYRLHRWSWDWAMNMVESSRANFSNLRQYVRI